MMLRFPTQRRVLDGFLMRGFFGVTDFRWYDFLRSQPGIDEVNFWRPGGGGFQAIAPGEPFFFKLKKPYYAIGGYGIFVRHALLPARLAWEAFGKSNGAGSFDQMLELIAAYRKDA